MTYLFPRRFRHEDEEALLARRRHFDDAVRRDRPVLVRKGVARVYRYVEQRLAVDDVDALELGGTDRTGRNLGGEAGRDLLAARDRLTVEDDGMGVPEEELAAWNGGRRYWAERTGEKIGLTNVMRRVYLLYGEDASASFSRGTNGKGLRIEFLLDKNPHKLVQTDENPNK